MDDTDLGNKNVIDKLAMACRRYQQIAPNAGGQMTLGQPELLRDWLERDVCEIVAGLMVRPGFRRRVRWSTERLTGENICDERRAVVAVESGLLRYAKALLDVAGSDEMRYQLSRLNQYLGLKSRDSESDDHDEVKHAIVGLDAVEFIASRPWRDLVSWRDFFGSASQFNLKDSDPGQSSEFLPFVNKPLLIPGDFVIRCLMIRITTWKQDLDRFRVRCSTARQNGNVDAGPAWVELDEISSEFNKSLQDLRALCFEGSEAQIRDSCVALLQIYAEFHPQTDLGWLGPAAKMVQNIVGLSHHVLNRQEWDVPERAAKALIDIADLVRHQQAPDDVIDEKKRLHRLVLVEGQREGFFDGETIDRSQETKWHGTLHWELLWELAERAILGRNVDAYCLSNTRATKVKVPPSYQAVKDRRADLKKLIVPELNDLIDDAGTGTYQLALDPNDICLLVWEDEEHLRVLKPQMAISVLTPF